MVEYLKKLSQRKMAQWALAYAAGAWVALQAIGLAADGYGWSPMVVRVAFGIALIGFIATLILAWYHGERGEQKATSTELLILTVLLAVGGGVMWRSERSAPAGPAADAATVTDAATAAPTPATPAINPRSIAVLPFANLSADKDNAYFAEGIQDEILTKLSKIADLKVISRTSTLRYASSPENLPEIARALGVANILEGSVQKVGNAVRINVQLIRADTDAHLWAEIYDRQLVDIFSIQSEVTSAIAKALQATLTLDERRDVAAKPTSNTVAYESYLRGVAADRMTEYSPENTARARDYYLEAVRLDPDFAEAWRRLTQVLSLKYFNEIRTPAGLAALKKAADTVERLQPDSGNAWLAKGYYSYRGLRDYPGARDAFTKAVEREPNNAEAVAALGYVLRRLGDVDAALAYMAKAESLDPANPGLPTARGEVLLALRRFDEAHAAYDRARQIAPEDQSLKAMKATVYQAQGKLSDAKSLLLGVAVDSADQWMQSALQQQAWLGNQPARLIELCRSAPAQPDPMAGLYCLSAIADAQRLQGKTADAFATCRAILDAVAKPGFAASQSAIIHLTLRGNAHACLGDRKPALKDLEQALELASVDAKQAPFVELRLAQAHVLLGDNEAAIALLKHSLSVPYGITVEVLRLDPAWFPLRKDPRFQALLVAR